MAVFKFNSGIPSGCVEWLKENVGEGTTAFTYRENWEWRYERKTYRQPNRDYIGEIIEIYEHCPTIEIKDEEKAVLFALKWC